MSASEFTVLLGGGGLGALECELGPASSPKLSLGTQQATAVAEAELKRS